MYAAPPNHPDNNQAAATYQSPAKRSSSITSANSPDEGSEITHCKCFNATGDNPRRSSIWRTSDKSFPLGSSSDSTDIITYRATTRSIPESAHMAACGVLQSDIHNFISESLASFNKGHFGTAPSYPSAGSDAQSPFLPDRLFRELGSAGLPLTNITPANF